MPKKVSLPKKLTLDYNTWRSGSGAEYAIGKGPTKMLNPDGYSCCLGQFSLQAGVDRKCLLHAISPRTLKVIDNFIVTDLINDNDLSLSKLANMAMSSNDNYFKTANQRAEEIKELFEEYGFEVELVNFPEE